MKFLNFEVWFYIYLTNTKKFFLGLVAAVFNRQKDPSPNSWLKQKTKKRIKLLYIFLLGELNKYAKKFILIVVIVPWSF